mmetsp:Transcript_147576/g.411043  ORF Transcript_147576/g.411043 Transcript_147576/m.411043 type:complete len:245 (+) Transcript_147576:47-781(+)
MHRLSGLPPGPQCAAAPPPPPLGGEQPHAALHHCKRAPLVGRAVAELGALLCRSAQAHVMRAVMFERLCTVMRCPRWPGGPFSTATTHSPTWPSSSRAAKATSPKYRKFEREASGRPSRRCATCTAKRPGRASASGPAAQAPTKRRTCARSCCSHASTPQVASTSAEARRKARLEMPPALRRTANSSSTAVRQGAATKAEAMTSTRPYRAPASINAQRRWPLTAPKPAPKLVSTSPATVLPKRK